MNTFSAIDTKKSFLLLMSFIPGQIDGQEITAAPVLVPKSRPPPRRQSPWRQSGPGGWRRSPPRYRGGGGGGGGGGGRR